jgi:hypothetical protein
MLVLRGASAVSDQSSSGRPLSLAIAAFGNADRRA